MESRLQNKENDQRQKERRLRRKRSNLQKDVTNLSVYAPNNTVTQTELQTGVGEFTILWGDFTPFYKKWTRSAGRKPAKT